MRPQTHLRTTEHASIAVALPIEQRRAIAEAARLWQETHRLSALPLNVAGG